MKEGKLFLCDYINFFLLYFELMMIYLYNHAFRANISHI